VDAYTIAFAVLMLSAGGMGDLLGSKRLFQLGMLVFGIASFGCGVSWDVYSLIGFRVLQGGGAAVMLPSSLSILNHSFSSDKTHRAHGVSLWTAAGAVSIAAGPVLGGLLIHISNWRMIFFVNVPICLIGLLCSIRLRENVKRSEKGFDIPGQIAWLFTLTALIAAIIEWSHLGFKNPLIFGGIIFSMVALLLFFWIEKRACSPILPLEMFKSSSFNVLILLGTMVNCTYYGTVFVLSLYLQNVLHYSVLLAGLGFIPLTAGFIVSNLISGRLTAKYGIRVPILLGTMICATGYICLFLAKANTPYWHLLLPFIAIPLGMGLAVPAMTTGILTNVVKTYSGVASAVLNTSRQAAGAIGVAIFGAMANGGPAKIVNAIALIAVISAGTLVGTALIISRYLKNA